MSQYLDVSTFATEPGQVELSTARLYEFRGELGLLHRWIGPGRLPDGRFAEHLKLAAACAAVAIKTSPDLLVAAYSDDLDAVAMLRFPRKLGIAHGIEVGARLLSVNTYGMRPANAPAGALVDSDLVAGPGYINWYSFHPLIADFLCDAPHQIHWSKSRLRDTDWERAAILGHDYIKRFPNRTRNGNPYLSFIPAR